MIETERLLLRPFREGDAADVFEYLKEPTVNCFACMKLNSLEEAKQAVVERSKDAEDNPIYENTIQWAILKRNGREMQNDLKRNDRPPQVLPELHRQTGGCGND